MRAYIEIGGCTGKTANEFKLSNPEFDIFVFECDEKNIERLRQYDFNLIQKAAWSSAGLQRYYYGREDGGTLYPKKKTGKINPNNYYDVETVDFAQWLQENFTKDDYIILAMNCEGSEYEIIEHLNKKGLTRWIDKWLVDWHWEKIGLPESEHDKIKAMI